MTSDPYFLSHGGHAYADDGRCAMEWVAFIAGEEHTDEPECVSPALRDFCIGVNDALGDADRQKLRPYLARCIGTVNDGLDDWRDRMIDEALMSADSGCSCLSCFVSKVSLDSVLALLDRLLPKEAIDIPAPVAGRAREVCEVAS